MELYNNDFDYSSWEALLELAMSWLAIYFLGPIEPFLMLWRNVCRSFRYRNVKTPNLNTFPLALNF